MSIEIELFGWYFEISLRSKSCPIATVLAELGPITVWRWER